MAVYLPAPIPYHQQEKEGYCGAACQQMLLNQEGISLSQLDQSALLQKNTNHAGPEGTADTTPWSSTPNGLLWTMQDRAPQNSNYQLFHFYDAEGVTRKIVWAIQKHHTGSIALVFDAAHWLTVCGCTISQSAQSPTDSTYQILSLDVNNPWPAVPANTGGSPPPHSLIDGCGNGGDRGSPKQTIGFEDWEKSYMTGVKEGYWAYKFIALGKEDGSQDRGVSEKPKPPQNVRKVIEISRERRRKQIPPKSVKERALSGLEKLGLLDRPEYKEGLNGATYNKPILVHRIEVSRSGEAYYILQVVQPRKAHLGASVVVSVDASSGNYLQSVAGQNGGIVFSVVSRDVAEANITNNILTYPDSNVELKISKGALQPLPDMYWEPCSESLSPFYPFYIFLMGARQIYVRSDGAVFTELHTNRRGD